VDFITYSNYDLFEFIKFNYSVQSIDLNKF